MSTEAAPGALDLVGIGSMAVDRIHRVPKVLGPEEKGVLREIDGVGPVQNHVGGVMLNQLGWAAALGLRVGITGRQGSDAAGQFLRNAMDRSGIERHIIKGDEASTLAEIFVADDGGRAIYMAPGATLATHAEHIRADHAGFIQRAARFSTEISQLPLDAVREALTIARAAGIPTVLDFDVTPSDALTSLGDEATLFEVLALVDLLKPSKAAVRELVPGSADDALGLARALRERFGCGAVVVTDGEAGCAIHTAEFEGVVAAKPAKVIDTTGAGDAFLGGLLTALHLGADWPSAGAFANACGAACCEQLGAFPEDALAARARVAEGARASGVAFPALPERGAVPALGGAPAAQVLETGARELRALADRFEAANFTHALEAIRRAEQAGGRLHFCGVGKPEHVARYAAGLFSSTGTPAAFLHATETLHGSLGQVRPGDVVVAISNSGETAELLAAVDALAKYGAVIIAVTAGLHSSLARAARVVLDAGVASEGGPLGLAPRASVAAEVMVLAALSAELQAQAGFSREDYAELHPAGALGKKARKS
jgi:arabinose-5-phosphate isomerase